MFPSRPLWYYLMFYTNNNAINVISLRFMDKNGSKLFKLTVLHKMIGLQQ